MVRFYRQEGTGPRGFTAWIQPSSMRKHFIECCDCALVHEFQFRVVNGQVQFRARRADRYTARQRKRRGRK